MSGRPDYCPIGNEPCQSLCDTPCGSEPKEKLATFSYRLASDSGYSASGDGYRITAAQYGEICRILEAAKP